MEIQLTIKEKRNICKALLMLFTFCFAGTLIQAQTSVYTIQHISFGAFTNSGGSGTIVIAPSGTRTATGFVVPLNLGVQYKPAILEIEAPYGTIISIQNSPNVTLTGSNGGTMSVHLNESDPILPYTTIVSPPARTQIKIGGTLSVGNASSSPPGNYSGTLEITFNYQ